MSKAKDMNDWWHTAALICVQYNLNRGKRRPKTPADFHPFFKPKKVKLPASDVIDDLIAAWCPA
jgi:hypothetical protein